MAVKTAGALKLNICLTFGPRRSGNLPSKNKYLVVGGTRLSLPLHYFDKSFCTEKLIGQYEEAIRI